MAKKYHSLGRKRPVDGPAPLPTYDYELGRFEQYGDGLWEPEQAARDMLCAGLARHVVCRKLREQFKLDIRESTRILRAALK